MDVKNSNKDEYEKLYSYSFSLDCLIFGFKDGEINLLLIKRENEPYKDNWAIPEGLVYPKEDLPDAASRILYDITSLKNVNLHQSMMFGKPNRHPHGRVITCSYFALVRMNEMEMSSRAKDIKWVPIYKVPSLALDHNEIVLSTIEILKVKLKNEPICFDLLEDKFTLNELQQVYEYAFKLELNKANFRKKIKPIPLIDQEEKQVNVKHRPAKLFSFDREKYQKLVEEQGFYFKM